MPRQKQTEMPIEGPGVAPVKFKDLDRLGDSFIEVRDQKAKLATELGELEKKIADAMTEHGISKYMFGDQEMVLEQGKTHVKIKTVKTEGVEPDNDND